MKAGISHVLIFGFGQPLQRDLYQTSVHEHLMPPVSHLGEGDSPDEGNDLDLDAESQRRDLNGSKQGRKSRLQRSIERLVMSKIAAG
jgi:hypothetical protein